MNRKGVGVGTASLILVFTVLSLVIFTIISHITARNEMVLASSEAQLVRGYYEADALANQILTELIQADTIPASVLGVDIHVDWDSLLEAQTVEFSCSITYQKELFVKIAFFEDSYNILVWQIRNTGEWEHDRGIPLLFT